MASIRLRAVMGLMAAALAGCLTACTGAAAPTAPAGGPGAPDGGGQPKVNRLVMAMTLVKENNDPRQLRTVDLLPLRPFYEYTVGVDQSDGKLIPQLATSWTVEPDGTSFRFQLRPGVKWHQDRGEFKASDLVDILKLQMRDETENRVIWVPLFKDIEAVNDREAIVRLKGADSTFLTTFSEQRGVFPIFNPAHFSEMGTPTMQGTPPVGTGPYQFKERGVAQFTRYARVPYQHWRTTPDFPEFEFRFINEPSTRMAALVTGEVQIAELPDDLKTQAEKQGFKLIAGKVPTTQVYAAFYCCHVKDVKNLDAGWAVPNPKMGDVRVRKALSKALNRDALNRTFFRGKGVPLYLASFEPARLGWNPEWEKRFAAEYGYDQAAAKALLADAGYSAANPLVISMVYPSEVRGGLGGEDLTDAIGNMWRAIGVNVQNFQSDPGSRKSQTDALKLGDHVVVGATASDQWTSATSHGSTTPGALRGREVELPAADALLGQIRTTLDDKKLDDLWRQVGNAYFEGARNAPLFTVPPDVAVNPSIVADWTFPGSMTGYWTHVFSIKAVRQ